MTNTNNQDWQLANQQYLMANLRMLQEELEWYQIQVTEGTGAKKFEQSAEAMDDWHIVSEQLPSLAAIDIVTNIFNLSSFEQKILLMCAGVELVDHFGHLIASLQGSPELFHPSFNLTTAAFSDAHWSAISPASPLRYWNLVHLQPGLLIAKSPLKIDEHILHYLTGFSYMDEQLNVLVKPLASDNYLVDSHQVLVDDILQTSAVQNQQTRLPVIHLEGKNNLDKTAIAAAVSKGMGLHLYQLSLHAIPEKTRDITFLTRLWNREAALNSYSLYLDCNEWDTNDKTRLQSIISFMNGISSPLILNNCEWATQLNCTVLDFKVEKPRLTEQLLLWKTTLDKPAKHLNGYLEQVVGHFNLSTQTIVEASTIVVKALPKPFRKSKKNTAFLKNTIWKTCCKYTRPKVDNLVQYLEPVASWETLILPKKQKDTLREIAQQVKSRNKVYNEWGFGSSSSRGFGISALFTGESGTGKTMASEVIAKELQLDLYRIDLSQVVNKYIGETEKNLKRIFDAAEEGGAILLFDEADALFGKRSDVKDSHDRYSNIEVSYLLQRMENYRGLAILTTNMKSAIDKAFLRRIRFVINFERPDIAFRAEIWKHIFPAETPLHEDVDIHKLAKLNVPGGNIKNVAMNAAFIAAAENEPVQMAHILHAVRNEYQKLEKNLSQSEVRGW